MKDLGNNILRIYCSFEESHTSKPSLKNIWVVLNFRRCVFVHSMYSGVNMSFHTRMGMASRDA